MQSSLGKKLFITIILIILVLVVFYYFWYKYGGIRYEANNLKSDNSEIRINPKIKDSNTTATETITNNVVSVTHIETPKVVKSIYLSNWTAGSPKYRIPLIKLIDDTELNSVVIDIKDSTGKIGFKLSDPYISQFNSEENRIENIRGLIDQLHKKKIYVIGRISVFQDPFIAKSHPHLAVTKKSDGNVWKDRKGLSFLDPANKEVWNYILAIAKSSYKEGFDEINFDYVRYPSDGNIKDINYHLKEGMTRSDNLESFFKFLNQEMKKDTNIPISADLFGLTTEVNDDMGIGQVWEKAFPYFDYLAPMIYPSHYPKGHKGYDNPAIHPYEVIYQALKGAISKSKAISGDIDKIRPWLQDFDLGANYGKTEVLAQIKAVYDLGLDSWMLWDANNKYTPSALLLENRQ